MTLAHAVFASLEIQPMRGYALQKFFDSTRVDLEQEGWGEKNFIKQDHKPHGKKYSITKTGRVELHRGRMSPSITRIKAAEDLERSQYNSKRTWPLLDEHFHVAQVVGKHPALRRLFIALTSPDGFLATTRRYPCQKPKRVIVKGGETATDRELGNVR